MRGTPQQIIDKYLALARDAQLSNDRVAEQNFLQHAEHYTRLLGEAQREQQREQEARQVQGDGGQGGNGQHGQNDRQQRNRHEDQRNDRQDDQRGDRDAEARRRTPDEDDDGPGLVETPETRAASERAAPMMPEMPVEDRGPDAKADAPKKPGRAPRGPRKPREAKSEGGKGAADDTPPASAAE